MDIRKYSFSHRKISEWNKLSTYCITASSVNMFKDKVQRYLRRADWTYIKNVGPSIIQWLPCPLAIWIFALDGNLVKCLVKSRVIVGTFTFGQTNQQTSSTW